MTDLLKNITNVTRVMWYELNDKDDSYNLVVNGLGEVKLLRNYKTLIAAGNENIQKAIKELLSK